MDEALLDTATTVMGVATVIPLLTSLADAAVEVDVVDTAAGRY